MGGGDGVQEPAVSPAAVQLALQCVKVASRGSHNECIVDLALGPGILAESPHPRKAGTSMTHSSTPPRPNASFAKRFSGPRPAGLRVVGTPRVIPLPDNVEEQLTLLRIGSGHSCELRLDDETVSPLHGEVITALGQHLLRDVTMKSGVEVGRHGPFGPFEVVAKVHLEFGLYLRLGAVMLTVVDEEGRCELVAASERELFEQACFVYGSTSEATRALELPI